MASDIELEELRQLQAIIARHEEHAFKIRGVMYALLTALAVPVFTNDRLLTGGWFIALAVLLIGLSFWAELVHRTFVRLAINRVLRLEEILRSDGSMSYDGPLISKSLGRDLVPGMLIYEARLPSCGFITLRPSSSSPRLEF